MKRKWLIKRMIYALKNVPTRFIRLLTFFKHPFYRQSPKLQTFLLLLLDLFFLFDFYEILTTIFKKSARPLRESEILRGYEIFNKSIDYQLVILDEKASVVCKDHHIIYVSFFTINSWGTYSDDILIHELVHVWQYHRFGAGYIAAALAAHKTKEGYNYTFEKGWQQNPTFLSFNPEQQADMVQDYYRLKKGGTLQWTGNAHRGLASIQKFMDEIS